MQEYQRQIKRGFKESHSAGNKRKMYQQYKEAVERGDTEGVVVRLEINTSGRRHTLPGQVGKGGRHKCSTHCKNCAGGVAQSSERGGGGQGG